MKNPIIWLAFIAGTFWLWFVWELADSFFKVVPLLLWMGASLAFWALAVALAAWIAARVWKATIRK
jgi:hypothetical protein